MQFLLGFIGMAYYDDFISIFLPFSREIKMVLTLFSIDVLMKIYVRFRKIHATRQYSSRNMIIIAFLFLFSMGLSIARSNSMAEYPIYSGRISVEFVSCVPC